MCFNLPVACNLCVLNVTNVPRDVVMLMHVRCWEILLSAFSIRLFVFIFYPPGRRKKERGGDNVIHIYTSSLLHKCRAWLRVVGNCGVVFRGDISSEWMFKIWAGKPFISIYSYLPNIWLSAVYLYKKLTLTQRVLFTEMNLTSTHNSLAEVQKEGRGKAS